LYRIGVVGGGFAGLYVAYRLSEGGYDVTLFEEHGRVGFPRHCTGLVSQWVVERIGPPAREAVLERYLVYRMRVPGEGSLDLVLSEPSYRLERVMLEENLLKALYRRGVDVRLGCRVRRVSVVGGIVSCGGRESYDAVIVATGHHGRGRIMLPEGLDSPGWRPRVVWGVNVEALEGPSPGRGVVQIDLDGWNKGFFYWLLETGEGVLAGGASLGGPPGPSEIIGMYGLGRAVKTYGGPILTGPPHPRPWLGRVFLLGDVAGHNKPLTGGGLFPTVYTVECMVGAGVEGWPRCLARTRRMLSRQLPIARLFHGLLGRGQVSALIDSIGGSIRVSSFDRHEGLLGWEGWRRWVRAGVSLFYRSPGAGLRVLAALFSSYWRRVW